MYALNLSLSPERAEFWESADPIMPGAGETESALKASARGHPGVSDSIEPDNVIESPRQGSLHRVLAKPTGSMVE